jgi:lysine 2,3-aminomutase
MPRPQRVEFTEAPSVHSRADPVGWRRKFFPGVTAREWNDWRWQLRHRIRDVAGLEALVVLTDEERRAVVRRQGTLPLGFTPYYATLVSRDDPCDPIRRTMIPLEAEWVVSPGEYSDSLGEEAHSPVPGLVHTYPDKVLFLVSDFCATYCRYCTRSRMVGGGLGPSRKQWEAALAYIAAHPEVRDVLLSGGDPLILSDERLEWLLKRLHALPHVEMIRIGTKIPAVLPQRITPALVRMLKRYHPLYFSVHFTHPAELTPEVERACARLANAGIPMGSQTVLLAGVNDDAAVMKALMLGLLRMRVKPYYLHQCDAVAGSAHFRTPIATGEAIIRALHGHTTGYAVPTYMLDAPGGGGKVPLTPNYVESRKDGVVRVRNHEGARYSYRESRPDERA